MSEGWFDGLSNSIMNFSKPVFENSKNNKVNNTKETAINIDDVMDEACSNISSNFDTNGEDTASLEIKQEEYKKNNALNSSKTDKPKKTEKMEIEIEEEPPKRPARKTRATSKRKIEQISNNKKDNQLHTTLEVQKLAEKHAKNNNITKAMQPYVLLASDAVLNTWSEKDFAGETFKKKDEYERGLHYKSVSYTSNGATILFKVGSKVSIAHSVLEFQIFDIFISRGGIYPYFGLRELISLDIVHKVSPKIVSALEEFSGEAFRLDFAHQVKKISNTQKPKKKQKIIDTRTTTTGADKVDVMKKLLEDKGKENEKKKALKQENEELKRQINEKDLQIACLKTELKGKEDNLKFFQQGLNSRT